MSDSNDRDLLPTWSDIREDMQATIDRLKSLLHRCLNTGLRDDKCQPLYGEVCRELEVEQ